MNRRAIQKELDLVAADFDKKGWRDLADKVDHCCNKLMNAEKGESFALIGRALERINREADRRSGKVSRRERLSRKDRLASRASVRRRILERARKRRAEKEQEAELEDVPLRVARLRRLKARRG